VRRWEVGVEQRIVGAGIGQALKFTGLETGAEPLRDRGARVPGPPACTSTSTPPADAATLR
jgi:hypothetical protein